MGGLAVVLLTLGALNAALAMTVGTCTQGDAGELMGGWITLILYLPGVVALLASRRSLTVLVALAPAAAIATAHSWFAVRLAYGYLVRGMSACFVKFGGFSPDNAGEWSDGQEPVYIALWLGLSILFWSGFVSAAVRARRNPSEPNA